MGLRQRVLNGWSSRLRVLIPYTQHGLEKYWLLYRLTHTVGLSYSELNLLFRRLISGWIFLLIPNQISYLGYSVLTLIQLCSQVSINWQAFALPLPRHHLGYCKWEQNETVTKPPSQYWCELLFPGELFLVLPALQVAPWNKSSTAFDKHVSHKYLKNKNDHLDRKLILKW